MQLIEQASLEALLHDTGSAYDDILVACGLLCLANGAFNPIGNKGERRSFRGPFLRDGMSDNKARCPRRMAAPAVCDIKGSAPPHAGPVSSKRLIQNFGALR